MRPFNYVTKLACGGACAVFIKKDKTLRCVGQDSGGHFMDSLKPEGTYIQAAAGFGFCVAIDSEDGHLEQWGETEYGNMATAPSGAYLKVAAEDVTAMAIKLDGSLAVWRALYASSNKQVTDKPTSGVFTEIACGYNHCLALKDDHTISAWGDNSDGQCTIDAAPSGYYYISIAAGFAMSYTLRTDGTHVVLEQWGAGGGWQALPTPPTLPVIYTKISACNKNAIALKSDKTIDVWGANVGFHGTDTGQGTIPTNKNSDIIDIGCGYGHYAILKFNGAVLSWGENLWGVCATWHNKCFKAATGMTISSSNWGGGTLLLKTDGTVCFAGAGEDFIPKPVPRIYGDNVRISGGGDHCLWLTAQGKCYGYGNNTFGQCDPPADTYFKEIAASNGFSLGIKLDGTIVGWGFNTGGILDGIPSGTFTKISANIINTVVAIRTDGSLVVWHGTYGADFGEDTPEGNDFIDVKAGFDYQAIALRSNGTVAVWGRTLETYTVNPAINENIIEIAAGSRYNVVLYANSTIAVWGDCDFGQDTIPSPNLDFIHIGSRTHTVIGIKSAKHTFASVAWGYNVYGECEIGL